MSQSEVGRAAASQLFVIEFDLNELSSHFFNQVLGFKLAAEERGLVPHVFLGKDVAPALADPLEAHRLIELDPIDVTAFQDQLDSFAEGDRQLRSLWDAIETMNVSSHDIVMITSSRPVVIYSLGAWLSRLPGDRRPAAFIRFFNHEYLDLRKMDFSEQSWMHRFAARDLSLRPGQERVFFTVNNERLIAPLTQLCARRVFPMPLPKYYGEVPAPRPADEGSPVIYMHLNVRSGAMLDQVDRVLHAVIGKYPTAKFLLKYTRNALSPGKEKRLGGGLSGRDVELVPSEQSHADHIATIARCDVVVLPYEATEYVALASGVFAEAAALGKVAIYPDGTWMAEQAALGHAAGVGFTTASYAGMSVAILRALDSLSELSAMARMRAQEFRAWHSCGQNLDLMRELAAHEHDMALRSVLEIPVKFDSASMSRSYLGRGWSTFEPAGVWSDGPVAELEFRVLTQPAGALDVHFLLTPFCSRRRPQRVTVKAGDSELGAWDFPDKGKRVPGWHQVTVPLHLMTGGEVHLQLHIQDPHSPQQAGTSDDSRALGVMLHEMRVSRR
jgi:hypothetical protein